MTTATILLLIVCVLYKAAISIRNEQLRAINTQPFEPLGMTTIQLCAVPQLPRDYDQPACWRDAANSPISNTKRYFV